jgi:hypothetical protein
LHSAIVAGNHALDTTPFVRFKTFNPAGIPPPISEVPPMKKLLLALAAFAFLATAAKADDAKPADTKMDKKPAKKTKKAKKAKAGTMDKAADPAPAAK